MVVAIIVVEVVVRRLMLAKLGQEENVGRTEKGWKVYNLINYGQYVFRREIPLKSKET